MRRILETSLILSMTTLCLSVLGMSASAQDMYYPLDQRQPAGVAGRWSVIANPARQCYMQPVRVMLPSAGLVSYYNGATHNPVLTQAPSQTSMMVGHVYRIKLSGMPEFPGVELYPTIEVLDRLHPPEDLIHEFPIPVEITREEIEMALQDRMVTKVIYLEQPDFAMPVRQEDQPLVEDLPQHINLLQAADYRGRPMAILRLGGRIPDPNSPHEFYSDSPILITRKASPSGESSDVVVLKP